VLSQIDETPHNAQTAENAFFRTPVVIPLLFVGPFRPVPGSPNEALFLETNRFGLTIRLLNDFGFRAWRCPFRLDQYKIYNPCNP
jgi:hypothetical protein